MKLKNNFWMTSLMACGMSLMACSDEGTTKVIPEEQGGADQTVSEDDVLNSYRNLGIHLDDLVMVDPCEGEFCSKSTTRKAGVVTADYQGTRAYVLCERNNGSELLYDARIEDSVLVQIVSESAVGDQGDEVPEYTKRASELLKASCSELGGQMVHDRAMNSYECKANLAFGRYDNKYWALFSDLVVSPCLGISVPDSILAVDPIGNGDEPPKETPVENPQETFADFDHFEMSAVSENTVVTFNGGVKTGSCLIGEVEDVEIIDVVALAKSSPSNKVASISVDKELASLVLHLPAIEDYCEITAPVVMKMDGDTLHVSYDFPCEYQSEYPAGTCEKITLSKCQCTSDHDFVLNSNFANAKFVEFRGEVYDVERKEEFEVAVGLASTGHCDASATGSDEILPAVPVTMLLKSNGRTALIIPQLVGDCSNRSTMSFECSGDTLVVTRLYNRNEPVTDCFCANDVQVNLENSYPGTRFLKIGRRVYRIETIAEELDMPVMNR